MIPGAGHLPSIIVPTQGHLDSLCVPTPGNLPLFFFKKNANAWGGGGVSMGGMGFAGID